MEVSWSPPLPSRGAAAITGFRIFYGDEESILVPLYVTRILLNFIISESGLGQSILIRSESVELPSELINVEVERIGKYQTEC